MSFLEKEKVEGEEKKSGAFWDWVVGIGLIVVVAAFTVFYQYQKKSSGGRFQQADSLFQAGKYREATALYEELKSAQYLTNSNDSIIYSRLDTMESMSEQEAALAAEAKKRLAAGDTAGARQTAAQVRYKSLLSGSDSAWLDSFSRAP